MATIKEIAVKCGVSTATVSKALSRGNGVSAETARRIIEAAEELGYFPNSFARALKSKRTNNIGVLFIDKTHSGLGHEYFSAILESVKSQAEKLGYDITFISRNIGGRSMTYLDHCRYRGCDGVVIASVDFNDPDVIELVNGEIPIVTIDHVFNSSTTILSDNVYDMRRLAEYIISRGHIHIAFIYGEDTLVTRNRLAGFHLACNEAGLNIPDDYLREARYHDPKCSTNITRELLSLKRPPTCIIYPDDFSALGGISEIESQGLSIPTDISIAGYDGIYLSQVMNPKLTTLKQNTGELGGLAVIKLAEAIEEPKTAFPERICVSGELLMGDTVKKIL